MKKILGLALAGAFLIACGTSSKNSSGMQGQTAATGAPANGDQNGGGSSIGSGQGNMSGSSTGPTGSGGSNSDAQGSQQSSPTNTP